MLVSISSGNSVEEVCRALFYFLDWLEDRYTFEIVKLEYARCKDGYKSILLESSDEGLLALEGTYLWRCQSPFRPKHKRKNWYFSLNIVESQKQLIVDTKNVIYQTMKSPKKGGQHVNTTCSGVRAIYEPLGVEAISYDERSQHLNKKIALERLMQKIKLKEKEQISALKNKSWREGKQIERGKGIKVFKGEDFKEVLS